jgi:hypothetical protein
MVAWMIRDPASDGGRYTMPSYRTVRSYPGIGSCDARCVLGATSQVVVLRPQRTLGPFRPFAADQIAGEHVVAQNGEGAVREPTHFRMRRCSLSLDRESLVVEPDHGIRDDGRIGDVDQRL